MKKLLSRFLVLTALFGCLSVALFTSVLANTTLYCPPNCYTDCKSAFETCVAQCPNDGPCVTACKSGLDTCFAYCDSVCP
jgi:hypothetical protein